MTETWKDIEGYEGLYKISDLGRVKSFKSNKEKILKPYQNIQGYMKVDLSKNSKRKVFKVHRLVAFAFINNPDNKPQVHHIDHNPENNKVSNLNWATFSEQRDDHWKSKSSEVKIGKTPGNAIKVIVDGILFKSATEASLHFGWSKDAIGSAKHNGKTSVQGKEFTVLN